MRDHIAYMRERQYYVGWETKFVDNGKQVTCYGHKTGYCELEFPHRLGSDGCGFHKESDHCDQCDSGFCDYHHYICPHYYDDESFTAQERNPGLVR